MQKHPDAADEIKALKVIVKEVRWHNCRRVRRTFKDADNFTYSEAFLPSSYRCGLVTVIHYAKKRRVKSEPRDMFTFGLF
jgi:mRNA-degrading endonuclease HigB of HigAB toxin-antitoxin module